MRTNQGPLATQYACKCKKAHPKVATIGGIPVLECPVSVGLSVWLDNNVPRLIQGRDASVLEAEVEALRLLVKELARAQETPVAKKRTT